MKGGDKHMKKFIAIAVAAAVLGLGATSFADLGSKIKNAAVDGAVQGATDGAKKGIQNYKAKNDQKATPAEDTTTAKKTKKKKKV